MSRRAQMAETVGALLDGALTGDTALDWLRDQSLENITPETLAGAADAVMARAVAFPAFPDALDCCGTGGDGLQSYNISTGVAFVLAAAGVTVAKHGNRAVSSLSGSADVLEALGVNTQAAPDALSKMLEQCGIAFLFAPTFHPGFAWIAPLRKALGTRTLFNVLGPLCNPARVERQVIGVFSEALCPIVAEACQLLGKREVLVVHGEDGGDELSISGSTSIAHLRDGKIQTYRVSPADAGLHVTDAAQLRGGDAQTNAQALRAVLMGTQLPYADAIALNAAAALMVAGKAQTLAEGVEQARILLQNGAAFNVLEHVTTMSQSYV